MRITLDQFPLKRTYSFSFLSLILMGLIAAIGPLDFLLINRLFGRPLLGWMSFPLIAVGLTVVLIGQTRPALSGPSGDQPDSLARVNRMEFLDIDTTLGVGRGTSLGYLYSHPATLVDVNVTSSDGLNSMSKQIGHLMTAPFGYPGQSFGGIQIAIEDTRLPIYEVPIVTAENRVSGSLKGLPLAPRSSKSVGTRYWFEPQLKVTNVTRPSGQPIVAWRFDQSVADGPVGRNAGVPKLGVPAANPVSGRRHDRPWRRRCESKTVPLAAFQTKGFGGKRHRERSLESSP